MAQNRIIISGIFAGLMVILAIALGWLAIELLGDQDDGNGSEDVGSTIIMKAQDSEVVISLKDLEKLPKASGSGSMWHTQVRIVGPLNYTGVPLKNLLLSYFSLNKDYSLLVRAKDNYTQTLTKSQVEGQVMLYDENEDPIGFGNVTPILAYEHDSEPLADDEGPFRLAFIGPNNPVTQGHLWLKSVAEIEIQSGSESWQLDLFGVINNTLTRTALESAVSCTKHQIIYETEVSGENQTYQGLPLWLLVAACDGDGPGPGASHFYFNESLGAEGYTVRLNGSSGFVDFSSSEIARNNDIILAVWCDGKPLAGGDFPLKVLGADVPPGKSLGGITQLWLINF
ncbi:MAG: hypothetical protein ACFFGZ_06640 [Candidatus Thorarchaeota archaeon]